MRRTFALATAAVLLAGACGDGIDDTGGAVGAPRGTIDGVVLHPVDSAPPDTEVTVPATEAQAVTTDSEPAPDASPFGWTEIEPGLSDGYLDVPLDYTRPDGPTISLYLVRHSAVDPANRIGTLLVNPGGPGYGGTGLAWSAENVYGQPLLDRFDIIGWDPRGTGFSDPAIDCIDNYDEHFGIDSSPDDAAERQALVDEARSFVQGCQQRNGDLLAHLSTQDSARDIDSIRRALGEDTISYFGFSYGSELGATWATMFPATVRAAVLDGAVDPTVGYLDQNIEQAAGFEAAFTRFVDQCSADTRCTFHSDGDAGAAFDALAAAIDAHPVEVDADRTPVIQGVLMTAVANAMYDEGSWPRLAQALADLRDGDGAGVLDMYDSYYDYYGDGTWGDELEAYFAIGCLDDPGTSSPDELFANEGRFAAAAPRLGRSWMAELAVCSVWPIPPVAPLAVTGAGAGPILVVGTTGDAATPLAGTRKMVAALEDGHLVVVTANQHTGYGVNSCVDDAVDGYLVDPSAPMPDERVCDVAG